MKAISVYDRPPVTVGDRLYPHISLYADSAIGRDVAPLFIPDIPLRWLARVCVAVRIVRLGKNIAEKFALRYVDAISTVCMLYPDTDDCDGADFTASGALSILDSAVTTGHWTEIDAASIADISVCVCGNTRVYDASQLMIARHISEVSRLATLKTGDILVLESTAVPVALVPDTRITASIGSAITLDLKVK